MHEVLNHTHDASARSWLASANQTGCAFPIQNLAICVFRPKGESVPYRGGVAIGDQIVDLSLLSQANLADDAGRVAIAAGAAPQLNELMALGPHAWRALRHTLFALLHDQEGSAVAEEVRRCLVPIDQALFKLPVQIGDYTDYYTSIDHATNIMRLFGSDEIGANFRWLPLAYHGRVSSIDISGHTFRRPIGQVFPAGGTAPEARPTAKLDYELELAVYIGQGNLRGQAIPLDQAEDHVFGIGLLNDWSARDIQSWEMNPLGPFLAKNFATTLSPWIVSMEALAPFRSALPRRGEDPASLAYLDSSRNRESGALDIQLEVWMETAHARRENLPATRLCATSFRHQYWTIAQMVTHHTINGCNLRRGDLLGSGTVSGPGAQEAGAMMELARNGAAPVRLSSGEDRAFVQDGDAITLKGYCERAGFVRIGFGESRGEVRPARMLV
ncbi:fumarylacetoacetase [Paraburkholderia sp. RAU6.4a]|uniref:fumarylacetoacetase n=1 Tax=Paraburkholderia sp. RAU6.4a TaxID=2991067 RepID=UPI003D23EB58